ncbi:hypothetical protein HY990_02415 [Candidatus Micrarchaeota archaeon]|nr:hypothetical protein [Candidatus Micrarchaeota archaeon]
MLLIEYLDDASIKIAKMQDEIHSIKQQFLKISDSDLRRDLSRKKVELKKFSATIKEYLLVHLDELRYLRKYYPDLLISFQSDPNIGPILETRLWLLDFKELPASEASFLLGQLRRQRQGIKEVRLVLRGSHGKIDLTSILKQYPFLRGRLRENMVREDAFVALDQFDRILLREGWLLLLTKTLIKIPLSKYLDKLSHYGYRLILATKESHKASGRGTVMETAALKRIEKLKQKIMHYEKFTHQILLANPSFLMSIKTKDKWLSHERKTILDKLARTITPVLVRERIWLNQMQKKLSDLE